MPQTPRAHVRALQLVSTPGQVDAVRHWTQTLLPLHRVPPIEQAVPEVVGGFEGTPAVHTSFVHWLPSTGTSVFLGALVTPPLPSHCFSLQSAEVCAVVTVPAAV